MTLTTNLRSGNQIPSGETLIVTVPEAEVIAGGIYQNNFPVIIDQSSVTLNFKLKKGWLRKNLPVGIYQLRIWFFDYNTMKGGGYRQDFRIT